MSAMYLLNDRFPRESDFRFGSRLCDNRGQASDVDKWSRQDDLGSRPDRYD